MQRCVRRTLSTAVPGLRHHGVTASAAELAEEAIEHWRGTRLEGRILPGQRVLQAHERAHERIAKNDKSHECDAGRYGGTNMA